MSTNVYVRWAVDNPDDAKEFWRQQRSLAQTDPCLAGSRLRRANEHLEGRDANLSLIALNAIFREYEPEFGRH